MTEKRNRPAEDFDDFELAYEPDLDIDADAQEPAIDITSPQGQSAWKRLEERQEARWLKEQLADWDDWDDGDDYRPAS